MSKAHVHGVINHDNSSRPTDYLYRLSIKAVVRNEAGNVLVVKEGGDTQWDLPGGGMDHGESIHQALARELYEEVSLRGEFTYRILTVEEPALVDDIGMHQVRLIFEVIPVDMTFSPGTDSSEVTFINPDAFRDSDNRNAQRIYEYAQL
jgi:8-oxo-dGTP diphosphatase